MRVFVTGGSGLIGSHLKTRLRERGDEVVILTRRADSLPKESGVTLVAGNPMETGPWMDAVKECDGVVNLVGEGIFNKRWNAAFKEAIVRSRIQSTKNVVAALAASPKKADGSPKVLVSASAIGYYGPHGDEELTESDPVGGDYMAQVCREWEVAASDAATAGVRLAIVRIGVVLDKNGGALAKMLTPFKMFVGGPVGNGKQYVSWIHHDDVVGLMLFALDRDDVSGPLNGTAPNPVTNAAFSHALGKALGRPSFMPTPGFMLRAMLGEVANVVVNGQRVLPKAALAAGYQFKYPEIDGAMKEILG